MKKVKYFLVLLLLLVGFSVKADGLEYYLSTSSLNYNYYDKNSDRSESHKRGDYFYVYAIINNSSNISNYTLKKGKVVLRWDSEVLSLVKGDNGKEYSFNNTDYPTINVDDVSLANNRIEEKYTYFRI